MMTPSPQDDPLQKEQDAFDARLDDLLPEHEGEFVVFKDGGLVGFFPSFAEAYRMALRRFGLDEVFLVSEVKRRGLDSVSVSWDLGVMYAN